MEFIYQKQSNLDEENNFTIEISGKKQRRKGKIYWWKRISFIKPGPKVKKQRHNKIDGLLRN